jgi:hypothetical protein
VKSRTTARFRTAFSELPKVFQDRAQRAYQVFAKGPKHPSLRFERVHPDQPILSVRITRDFRALGMLDGENILWFWIGSHADYEKLRP